MKRKKIDWGTVLVMAIFMVMGAAVGVFGGYLMGNFLKTQASFLQELMLIGVLLLVFFACSYLQVIIHEGGHLIFGLLSGYKFVSFRVGSHIFLKHNGKIVHRRFSIAGTGGQCLLDPPPMDDHGRFPLCLYNFGGAIAGVISAFFSGVFCILLWQNKFLFSLLAINAMIALVYAITNGIPLKVGGVANDGYNALCVQKDEWARRGFWLQLKINALQSSGVRLKDMPSCYFDVSQCGDLTNPLVASIAILDINKEHDLHNFELALQKAEQVLNSTPKLMQLYKNELNCEVLFYKIYLGGEAAEIESLYTKQLKKYITASKTYITRHRLIYAYNLLYKKDEQQAAKALVEFEKAAAKFPFPCEVESEREILRLIQNKAEQIK